MAPPLPPSYETTEMYMMRQALRAEAGLVDPPATAAAAAADVADEVDEEYVTRKQRKRKSSCTLQ